MTGPEHYKEAERLDALAAQQWGDSQVGDPCPQAMITAQRAQVHATLALAAATAISNGPTDTQDQAWIEATS